MLKSAVKNWNSRAKKISGKSSFASIEESEEKRKFSSIKKCTCQSKETNFQDQKKSVKAKITRQTSTAQLHTIISRSGMATIQEWWQISNNNPTCENNKVPSNQPFHLESPESKLLIIKHGSANNCHSKSSILQNNESYL